MGGEIGFALCNNLVAMHAIRLVTLGTELLLGCFDGLQPSKRERCCPDSCTEPSFSQLELGGEIGSNAISHDDHLSVSLW